MAYRSKLGKLLLLIAILTVTLLLPGLASAYVKCSEYPGNCTICDFYGPGPEYQGYIEYCR